LVNYPGKKQGIGYKAQATGCEDNPVMCKRLGTGKKLSGEELG
jgi:hypothetical protein